MTQKIRMLFRISFSLAMTGLLIGSLFGTAAAQEDNQFVLPEYRFPDEPADLDDQAARRAYRDEYRAVKERVDADEDNVQNYLSGTGDLAGTDIRKFMDGYVFGNMMALEQSQDLNLLNSLSQKRDDFIDDYVNIATARNRAQLIDQITIPKMREIAEDAKYHPAVRHNAVMIIGLLDSQEGERSTDTFPTPSANAATYLNSLAADANQADYLRVAALAGIQRHLMVGAKPDVFQTLLTIASQSLDDDSDNKDLDYWLKRRAVQCLGILKQPGPNGEVVTEMRNIIKDEAASSWLKFDALNTLAELDFASVTPAQTAGMSYEIAKFAAEDFVSAGNDLLNTREKLIWANAVYSDVDLELKGTNEANKDAQSRRGDNLQQGGGAGGFGDDANSGGGGGDKPEEEEDDTPKVELANYHLNNARRRAKIIAYRVLTAHRDKFNSVLAGDEKDFAQRTLPGILQDLIDATDVGIINLDEEDENAFGSGIDEPGKKKSNTEVMALALQGAGNSILSELPGAKKNEDAGGEAGQDVAAPAANGGSGEPVGDGGGDAGPFGNGGN